MTQKANFEESQGHLLSGEKSWLVSQTFSSRSPGMNSSEIFEFRGASLFLEPFLQTEPLIGVELRVLDAIAKSNTGPGKSSKDYPNCISLLPTRYKTEWQLSKASSLRCDLFPIQLKIPRFCTEWRSAPHSCTGAPSPDLSALPSGWGWEGRVAIIRDVRRSLSLDLIDRRRIGMRSKCGNSERLNLEAPLPAPAPLASPSLLGDTRLSWRPIPGPCISLRSHLSAFKRGFLLRGFEEMDDMLKFSKVIHAFVNQIVIASGTNVDPPRNSEVLFEKKEKKLGKKVWLLGALVRLLSGRRPLLGVGGLAPSSLRHAERALTSSELFILSALYTKVIGYQVNRWTLSLGTLFPNHLPGKN
ncbi:hypothetical protein CEXT_383721 [Caerostris extrusa]|uniref:Uncharacterized protein n=1 Tax=Caerostris extrusa TaxID=172846 RepID=A0AAV4MRE0_CAEEX|nr:hypothetical protein CEXT_383721 [Caerostris extrusa]